jgi:large subunit ribosomal protein L5
MNFQKKCTYLQKEYILKGNFSYCEQIPKLKKVIINTGVSKAAHDKPTVLPSMVALKLISGAHPVYTKAKKSIASFKLVKGSILGAKVTLRKNKMAFFLEKLIYIVFPKLEKISSVSKKPNLFRFQNESSISFGLEECIMFPEVEDNYEIFYNLPGIQITLIIQLKGKKEVLGFLSSLHIPVHHSLSK